MARAGVFRPVVPAAAALAVAGLLFAGCSSAPPPGDADTGPPSARPPISPADTTLGRGGRYFATVLQFDGKIYVDDFSLDFSELRFQKRLYGFYRDQYARVATISFDRIRRIYPERNVDDDIFERIYEANKQSAYRQEEIFVTRVETIDGRTEEFFAILSRMRGIKEQQRWEAPLAGNPSRIEWIELERR
jgi:hypothetical protein